MLTRGDRQRLERLPAGVHRSVTIGHEIGLKARGRNARIAERTGITDRSVRRHCALARKAEIHIPPAPPGRRPRTDYSSSRRGFRTSRLGRRRARELSPLEQAARAIARTGDSVGELVRLVRAIQDVWREHPHMSEREAAAALRMYLDAGGRLGPEAERWWRHEARRLPLDRAHTPWRAAASPVHLAPWLARRRVREREDERERERAARAARYDASAREERLTAEQIDALRVAALGRVRRPS